MRWMRTVVCVLVLLGATASAAEPEWGYLWPDNMAWVEDAPQYYVHPEGRAENTGAKDSPWDLVSALSGRHRIAPGSILWLRKGTYGRGGANEVRCNLKGTRERPIIVRGYPGELATLDGGITMLRNTPGEHVWFWGFEIMNSEISRSSGRRRPCGFNVSRPGVSMINLIVHDVGHGPFSYWVEVGDAEVHGCVTWGSGYYDMTDKWQGNPRGSGFYTQNKDGTRRLTDNISFRQFTNAMKCWSHNGYVQGYTLEGNVLFDTGMWNLMMSTSKHPIERMIVRDNFTYRKPQDSGGSVILGAYGGVVADATVRDNVIVGPEAGEEAVKIGAFEWLDLANNTFFGQVNGIRQTDFVRNRYLDERPKDVWVYTRPNQYEPGRGHVIVYNWPKNPSVSVDLSRILPPGTPYAVRDAQNYFGTPVAKGVFDGTPVQLPMTMTKVAQPVGDVPHIRHRFAHTAPDFAVFVVIPRGGLGPLKKLAPQPEKQTLEIIPAGGVFTKPVDVTLNVPKGTKPEIRYVPFTGPPAPQRAMDMAMTPYRGPVKIDQDAAFFASVKGRERTSGALFRIVWEKDPPVRSAAAPQGVVRDVKDLAITIQTDEKATVRFSEKHGVPYEKMTETFATTGGTEHRHPVENLKPGEVRRIYVRACDEHGNSNLTDYQIAFCRPDKHVPFTTEIEAEAGELKGAIEVAKDATLSGGKFIIVAGGMTGTAHARYTIDVPCTGAYALWCYVWGRSSNADSFRVSVDGGPEDIFDMDEVNRTKQWRWSILNGRGLLGKPKLLALNPRLLLLSKGTHTLSFRGREANACIDRLVLTNDLKYTPE